MTISEAIHAALMQRGTETKREVLVRWLSTLDGQIFEQVVRRYERDPQYPSDRPTYDNDTDLDGQQLMISHPYDELYPTYLIMRIDLNHADFDRYNNDLMLYNQQYKAWANNYNQTHRWMHRTDIRF